MSLLTKSLFKKYLTVFLFVGFYLILGCKTGFAAIFYASQNLEVNPEQVYAEDRMYTYSDGNPSIIYLKFLVPSFNPSENIASATLQLYVDRDLSSPDLSNVAVYAVPDSSWDSVAQSYNYNDISWDNRPTLSKNAITTGVFDGDQLMTWDLTKFDFKDNIDSEKTITFALENTPDSGTNNTVFYSNLIQDKAPLLAINYGAPPAPTTPEPSSIILGLISFCGLLSFKRKNKHN